MLFSVIRSQCRIGCVSESFSEQLMNKSSILWKNSSCERFFSTANQIWKHGERMTENILLSGYDDTLNKFHFAR